MLLLTDCLLVWAVPNGPFSTAHIVRNDKASSKISYFSPEMTFNRNCCKINGKYIFRKAKFNPFIRLELFFSFTMYSWFTLFIISLIIDCPQMHCLLEICTATIDCVYTGSQKGEEAIVRVLLCWFWCVNSTQITDRSLVKVLVLFVSEWSARLGVVPALWGVLTLPYVCMVTVKPAWNVPTSVPHRPAKPEKSSCPPPPYFHILLFRPL